MLVSPDMDAVAPVPNWTKTMQSTGNMKEREGMTLRRQTPSWTPAMLALERNQIDEVILVGPHILALKVVVELGSIGCFCLHLVHNNDFAWRH